MNKWFKSLLIFFISVLYISCSEETTEPSINKAKIIGKVTDTVGNLLDGVDIFLVYNLTDMPSERMSKVTGIDTVVLIYAEVEITSESVKLTWYTASEINNQGFEIQRKTVGDFEAIGYVTGNGTTTEPKSYSFIDTNVTVGNYYYYRLKQIDFNGSYQFIDIGGYSIPIPLTFNLYQNYPNPVQGTATIKYGLEKRCFCELEILNFYTSESLLSLVNKEQIRGMYTINFNNTIGLTNNIYNIYFKAIGVYFTEYEDTVTMLLNETDVTKLIEIQPMIKTENGYFELKLSNLPIKKIINITSEDSPDIIKQEIISNSVKFVLHKDGYVILEKEFQIDMNGQNEFNFVMEKQ